MTTIRFVDDLPRTLAEAGRGLRCLGALVTGCVDRDTPVDECSRETKGENPIDREATFRSTDEVGTAVEDAEFADFEFVRTVYRRPDEDDDVEPVEAGTGEGTFVGVRATL